MPHVPARHSSLVACALLAFACTPAPTPPPSGGTDGGSSGNTGTTGGTGNGDMKPNECVKTWQPGTYGWTRAFPDLSYTPELKSGSADAVAVDAAGNVYLAGRLRKATDLDPTAGTDTRSAGARERVFVTKLKADGTYGWTSLFESCVTFEGLAAGPDGEVIFAGRTRTWDTTSLSTGTPLGPCDIDPGPASELRDSDREPFLMRLGLNGERLWTATADEANGSTGLQKNQPGVADVVVEADGSVKALLVDNGAPYVVAPGPRLGYTGAIAWKLSADGQSGEVVPAAAHFRGQAGLLLKEGGIAMLGGTDGGIVVRGRVIRTPGVLVDVVNADASPRFSSFLDYPTTIRSFEELAGGDFLVTGTIDKEERQAYTWADLDPGPLEKVVRSDYRQPWIARWTKDGDLASLVSTSAPEHPFSVHQMGDGQLLYAGIMKNGGVRATLDDRNGKGARYEPLDGENDGYLVKRRVDGTFVWGEFLHGFGNIHEIYVVRSPAGLVTVVGYFTGELDADFDHHQDLVTVPGTNNKMDAGFFVVRFTDRAEEEPFCGTTRATLPDQGFACGTCTSQKLICGAYDDGCGHVLDCGSCRRGLTCGALSPNACSREGKVLTENLLRPGWLALDGADAYFTAEDTLFTTPPQGPLPYGYDRSIDGYPWPVASPGTRIRRVKRDGSAPPVDVTSGNWFVQSALLTGDSILFVTQDLTTDDGQHYAVLRKVPKTGGPSVVLSDKVRRGTPIAVQGDFAYVIAEHTNGTPGYFRVPLDGSQPLQEVMPNGCPVTWFSYFDGERLYVTCNPGGQPTLSSMLPDGTDLRYLFPLGNVGPLAFTSDHVWYQWTEGGVTSLRRFARNYPASAVPQSEIMVPSVTGIADYAVGSDAVYFGGPDPSARQASLRAVFRWGFGASEAESVAEGVKAPQMIAADDSGAVWIDFGTKDDPDAFGRLVTSR